ncbi:uncharacterized protein LOC126719762 [Quercus robur]|uniref:uncharacterized protein LOC126719762 n=1 Tax=Quercus robur TaxID=38942 RepID=UPI002162939E|nr:uncharacterized protein LOC126719762 [Quercus robur]
MKGLVETIREPERSSTKSSVQGTIGQLSKRMQKLMSRHVTNANDSAISPGIDYFTKWVEAEPLASITQQNVKNFVWKNILCRTTVRTPTGETPFNLAYGSEAVIPAEVHMATHRVTSYHGKDNEEQLRLNLDLIDEVRTEAEHKAAKYKNLMARQYDAMVKPRRFNIGDLILRKVSLATKNPAHGKLSPNWEGLYRVINFKRQGSYYLEALEGRKLEHPWNVEHLRKYYQ